MVQSAERTEPRPHLRRTLTHDTQLGTTPRDSTESRCVVPNQSRITAYLPQSAAAWRQSAALTWPPAGRRVSQAGGRESSENTEPVRTHTTRPLVTLDAAIRAADRDHLDRPDRSRSPGGTKPQRGPLDRGDLRPAIARPTTTATGSHGRARPAHRCRRCALHQSAAVLRTDRAHRRHPTAPTRNHRSMHRGHLHPATRRANRAGTGITRRASAPTDLHSAHQP